MGRRLIQDAILDDIRIVVEYGDDTGYSLAIPQHTINFSTMNEVLEYLDNMGDVRIGVYCPQIEVILLSGIGEQNHSVLKGLTGNTGINVKTKTANTVIVLLVEIVMIY